MLFLRLLAKILKILHSDATPAQVAGGFCLGAWLGLTPFLGLHTLVLFALVFFLPVNIGSAFLALVLFKVFSFAIDPLSAVIGYTFLVEAGPLSGLWTFLYNLPVAPLTRFNNTVMLGSWVVAAVFTAPLWFGVRSGVAAYRTNAQAYLQRHPLLRKLASSRVLGLYNRLLQAAD